MEISTAQKQVDDWIQKYGVRYFDEMTNLGVLMEEVGELARIMTRKYGEQSPKDSEQEYEMEEELADILFVLICLANQSNIDIEAAFVKSLQKKSKRDSTRHKSNKKLDS